MRRHRGVSRSRSASDPELEGLITSYIEARAMWLDSVTLDRDLPSEGDIFEKFEATGRAFVRHPCMVLSAVRRKVSFLLETPDLYLVVKEDEVQGQELLRIFLSSLKGGESAKKSRS
ncbi:hypothetical protein [Ciceribacter sp. RN22]|uniref:hypothetical protein n=1 Tax=Ciceribacter sp. RN22 TaxID=2954932 RepID=UPI0020928BDA|nr:hypothetical protein [Ciceribacter sp. RN22]MCO6180897.1 hypothetical protein [Ciceribacter sp. RN22]